MNHVPIRGFADVVGHVRWSATPHRKSPKDLTSVYLQSPADTNTIYWDVFKDGQYFLGSIGVPQEITLRMTQITMQIEMLDACS